MSSRTFDLVLFGSTGFTGQIVAEYLATHHGTDGSGLRWALAGRNPTKLDAVRSSLLSVSPEAASLPLLIGDSTDLASLRSIASQTRVICSTAGPYALHGSLLVEACVLEGTHYCDITGEVQWIRRMIDAHHDAALAKKLRLVHCCGFDSIPSDLGTLMLQRAMLERHGRPCQEVKYFAGPTQGGFSGGTVASMLHLMEETKDRSIRRLLFDPYSLSPKDAPRGPDRGDQLGVRWDSDLQRWTAPFLMAAINTRIVRRSNALLGFLYGHDFRYSETTSFPKGFRGWLLAQGLSLGFGSFFALASLSPVRSLLKKTILPAPGQGPSKETQDRGFFVTYLIGKSQGNLIYGLVKANKDPGYGATAIMLAESALCLALQSHELPPVFGSVTPASSLGSTLLQRLQNAGMTWEISDQPFV